MKTIKEIAKNANFSCTITRHGWCTSYELERYGRKILIEHFSSKSEKYYNFSANGEIDNTTIGNYVFVASGPTFNGMTHTIANGNYAAKLTLEEIETLVYNN